VTPGRQGKGMGGVSEIASSKIPPSYQFQSRKKKGKRDKNNVTSATFVEAF
jgi:hypothetical protein